MSDFKPLDFAELYRCFDAPVAAFDCGLRCAPYNRGGIPFCCDTRHAVPAAYLAEWDYLSRHTDMWRLWQADEAQETQRLQSQLPPGQCLIECQGPDRCQRSFRSITCRSFPFFPYVTANGRFVGLSYYWEYEDRCWLISHLAVVTPAFRQGFVAAWDRLFAAMPAELETFRGHAAMMRRIFSRRRRAIVLLHRDGGWYKISPRSERMYRLAVERLPMFGDYKLAAQLPFADET